MDLTSGILQLAGVALGGFIASSSGRAARTADARPDAQRELMRMKNMRYSWTVVSPRDVDSELQEMRIAFAGAKVPWRLTAEFQSVCVDSISEANNRFYRYQDRESLTVAERSEARKLLRRNLAKGLLLTYQALI